MNVALENRNVYDEFVLEKDILYFRVGDRGNVCYHGKNFNLKKRVSTEEMNEQLSNPAFYKVNTDCYVNMAKIDRIQDGKVFFNFKHPDAKNVHITKLREINLKDLLKAN